MYPREQKIDACGPYTRKIRKQTPSIHKSKGAGHAQQTGNTLRVRVSRYSCGKLKATNPIIIVRLNTDDPTIVPGAGLNSISLKRNTPMRAVKNSGVDDPMANSVAPFFVCMFV